MKDIEKIQKYLIERLDKLNDDKYMKKNAKEEIARSNTVTNTSLAYMKIKNLELRIKSATNGTREIIHKVSE